MSDEQWVASYELWDLTEEHKRHILSSERWGMGRDVACSVRREDKSYNPTNLTKYCSKPLAWLAWVKTPDAARRRPYIFFCRKMNPRPIPHICQKTRKSDFSGCLHTQNLPFLLKKAPKQGKKSAQLEKIIIQLGNNFFLTREKNFANWAFSGR